MTLLRVLFGATVFLGAFLLFLVEPIAAKQLLPVLGGSAAVWITCLVFFQTALLCGYLYAHWQTRRAHWNLHFTLLALAAASAFAWTIRSIGSSSSSEHPIATVFTELSISIGLPFLMLSATSPLMQVWWSRLQTSGIPYRLFALSNLASLLALGLYPSIVEPHLTLKAQRMAWCCGFTGFALISSLLALKTRAAAPASVNASADEAAESPATSFRHKLLWFLLPMGAAMQLSAVTSYLTANVAAIPLLWILPLGVYLLTLILAFQFPRLLPSGILRRFLVVMLAGLGYGLTHNDVTWPMRVSIPFFLIEVLVACLFCHTEAYAIRPRRASESTVFYLLFAAGGALGSFLIGIASPLVFSINYDLPLTFLVTALLALTVSWEVRSQRLLWLVCSALMAGLLVMFRIGYLHNTTVSVRNFYAALSVKQEHSFPGTTVRTLSNGAIQHGTQIFGTDAQRKTPTTYYAQDSGVGLALRFCCHGHSRNIGVIGLGAGTLAAYGQPGDRITFYEINPAVAPIAQNTFTYIRESGAQVNIIGGDGRLSLARQDPQHFDVLVIDAFSGDAIPLHLLTTQAVALYRKHLAPGGILAFHISNQHVDLGPPIALLAKTEGMKAIRVSSFANAARGEFLAAWMLVSDNEAFFSQPDVAKAARQPVEILGLHPWTDDFSSLLPVLRW